MSEDTQMIADMTSRIFADLADPQTLNAAKDDSWRAPLWDALEEAGLTRAWLPEDAGGAGLDLETGFEILRVSGQYAAPVAIAETLLAGWALAEAGLDVPDGVMTVAPMRTRETFALDQDGAVAGTARSVAHGAEAAHVVVVTEGHVHLVPGDQLTATLRETDMGGERADLRFDGARPLASGALDGGLEALQRMGAVARACQITGALETALHITTEYTGEREAFGRKIGKFQAVQQNLAQLAGEVAAAMTASGSAAVSLGEAGIAPHELMLEVASAKIRVGEAAGTGGAIAHQAHGAIGWTSDHVLQRFTRRMWGWRDDFGSEAEWAVRLGELVAAEGGARLWPLITTR